MNGGLDPAQAIERLTTLPLDQRTGEVVALASDVDFGKVNGDLHKRLVNGLLEIVANPFGSGRERLTVGELLGQLGDPRIKLPQDPNYFVRVPSDSGTVVIGRFPVTNYEFHRFVDDGGYDRRECWSDEGWEWVKSCEDPWPVRAAAAQSRPFVVANQPVVGVTFHEASAFATFHGCRLPRRDERVWVMRGRERRPYPWGAPFGEGNANTLEEVLGRPCAVGLYLQDRTPEGVCDLAGNCAEWTADPVGSEQIFHPGAWDQPSLAAWAKAIESECRDARWAGLGFRLARDEET